jgi:hypothetical protein
VQDFEVDAAFDLGLLKGQRIRNMVATAHPGRQPLPQRACFAALIQVTYLLLFINGLHD